MHVVADRRSCIGSGMCVLAASEVFDQHEEDGTVRLLRPEVPEEPDELGERVHRAAMVCPARAITVHPAG
jgi:ferredoxin